MNKKGGLISGAIAGLFALFCVQTANAGIIHDFLHTYGYGADPTAVDIELKVFDGQPGGKYLWEYTVTNNSYDPNPGVSNGFSGFELFLPTPIAEIADITPNPSSSPPWDINCCAGNPTEWDIGSTTGLGVMPGEIGVFSFTTDPRLVAINDNGWFHTWQFDQLAMGDVQTDIVPTIGMHVPLVPGLNPIPEPGTLALLAVGAIGMFYSRRRQNAVG